MNVREKEVRNMCKVLENCYRLNDKTDLVYVPEDSGWYIYDSGSYRASAIYATRGEAIDAYTTDSVEWETK